MNMSSCWGGFSSPAAMLQITIEFYKNSWQITSHKENSRKSAANMFITLSHQLHSIPLRRPFSFSCFVKAFRSMPKSPVTCAHVQTTEGSKHGLIRHLMSTKFSSHPERTTQSWRYPYALPEVQQKANLSMYSIPRFSGRMNKLHAGQLMLSIE